MAEETIEKVATSQEAAKEAVIETSEQDASQESHDEQGDASDKTEQDAGTKAKRQAQSDFDKQTALLNKFSASPATQDRLQSMVDEALTAQAARQTQDPTAQTTETADNEEVATKADMLKFEQSIQGYVSRAIEEPYKRTAMAEMGSFIDESIKAGSITEDDRKRVQALIHVFDPQSTIKLGWDEVSNIAKEILQGKAALNILSKMKTTDVTKAEGKQEAMKDVAQPDAASTAQPGKEDDSLEAKTLAEFQQFHKQKSIFAK